MSDVGDELSIPIYVLAADHKQFMKWRQGQPGLASRYHYVSCPTILAGMVTYRVIQLEDWWNHPKAESILTILSSQRRGLTDQIENDVKGIIDVAVEKPEKQADSLIDQLPGF